jgi:hypothetical protein
MEASMESEIVKPINWFDKKLIYTYHAIERTLERRLPFFEFLPVKAKFKGKVGQTLMFLIHKEGKKILLIVKTDGVVKTVYEYNSYGKEFKYNKYHKGYEQLVDYDKYPQKAYMYF